MAIVFLSRGIVIKLFLCTAGYELVRRKKLATLSNLFAIKQSIK